MWICEAPGRQIPGWTCHELAAPLEQSREAEREGPLSWLGQRHPKAVWIDLEPL